MFNQRLSFASGESGQPRFVKLGSTCSHFFLQSPPFLGERDASRSAVGGVGLAGQQSLSFKQNKHRPHRIGIGKTAAYQFLLRDSVLFGQEGQQYKLIGGNAKLFEMGIRPAMQREIRATQCHRELVSFRHVKLSNKSRSRSIDI